jgi:alpha-glucosidase
MAQKWWQKAVFYQIYPRSFADGNGDGIGDFKGMTEKLDYLKSLGVDGLWLSPHFPSPNWDCGYDISDYEAVAPEYGTLEDFKTFLEGAHRRGLRVLLDLVLNHTSDEHSWFRESKSSRDNPKADWYVWEDAPPNNWQSCFDGPAWTYAPERGQYYYHYFMKQQPDLNWDNPEVRAAMWKAVRFWLDLGVDGFRLDAIGTIFEHPDRPDHPVPMTLAELRRFSDTAMTDEERKLAGEYWRDMFQYQLSSPHELMKELRRILDKYPGDRMLVGEDDDLRYLGNGHDELDLVFNFPLMRTERMNPAWVRANQRERLAALAGISPDAWPCNTLGNHDSSRILTRYGDRRHDLALARLNLALVLTLRGTPFLYNGEEIGMSDLMLGDIADFRDTMGSWYYHACVSDLGVDPQDALQKAAAMTRDKNRTPLQWTADPNAGFCPENVKPWLPVNPDHARGVNVEAQDRDPASLLNFYRSLLQVRRATPALLKGDYRPLLEESAELLAFLRPTPEQTVLVLLNYSASAHQVSLPELDMKSARLLFRSGGEKTLDPNSLTLEPFEVRIMELKG